MTQFNSRQVAVLLGNGSGGVSSTQYFALSDYQPEDVAIADFNIAVFSWV